MIKVVTTVSDSDKDLEITSLCHRRLGHAVGVVSMNMHYPSKGHWKEIKWILRCLLKIVDVGLVFE